MKVVGTNRPETEILWQHHTQYFVKSLSNNIWCRWSFSSIWPLSLPAINTSELSVCVIKDVKTGPCWGSLWHVWIVNVMIIDNFLRFLRISSCLQFVLSVCKKNPASMLIYYSIRHEFQIFMALQDIYHDDGSYHNEFRHDQWVVKSLIQSGRQRVWGKIQKIRDKNTEDHGTVRFKFSNDLMKWPQGESERFKMSWSN